MKSESTLQTRKVAIVTDSTACIHKELAEALQIQIVPQWVTIGQEALRDDEISPSEIFTLLSQGETITTAQVSPRDLLQTFETLSESVDSVLVVTLASRMSSTFSTAQLTARQFAFKNIVLFDSQTALGALGLVVLVAARAAAEGQDLQNVLERTRQAADRVRLFATLETLEYAARSGRAPVLAAILGEALRVYPVLELRHGKAYLRGTARTIASALAQVTRMAVRRWDRECGDAIITHANCPERAEKVASTLQALAPKMRLTIDAVAPSAAVHLGKGAVSLAVLNER